ncbi:MAG: hypothetical protein LBD75_07225 [Candidatus Peribacteria bacterium]|nr:hypothetical protein [Candidatus Peribacteria bacterium]
MSSLDFDNQGGTRTVINEKTHSKSLHTLFKILFTLSLYAPHWRYSHQ